MSIPGIPAGGTIRVPGCKDNRFFSFRQTFAPKSTLPGRVPDSCWAGLSVCLPDVFCSPVFRKKAAFPDITLPRSVCVAFRQEPCGLRICPVAALPPGIPDGAAISLRLSLPTGVRNPHPVRACTPRSPAPVPRPHSSARRR